VVCELTEKDMPIIWVSNFTANCPISFFNLYKRLWNTVTINFADVSDDLARELINHSYDLVI